MPSAAIVPAFRLWDTAVTPCERSIENATTRAYDGSLPTSVMSVPCSVVMVRGGALDGAGGIRRREHLVGQVRRGRVRHGVVGVNDVEVPLLSDARDRSRQRQQVLRLPEQRVRRHFDGYERQSGYAGAPSKRRLAADQMDMMASNRQRVCQFGRDHPAPADRRIAHHPDVHGRCLRTPERSSGSRTTKPSANATPARAPYWASRLSISCLNVGSVNRVATAPSSAGTNWLR